jgi:hypothetical protein
MARADCHSWLSPLLAISQTGQSLHLQENLPKSLFWKILPITLTRSRFYEEKFFPTEWNQDFAGRVREGIPNKLPREIGMYGVSQISACITAS